MVRHVSIYDSVLSKGDKIKVVINPTAPKPYVNESVVVEVRALNKTYSGKVNNVLTLTGYFIVEIE